MAFDPPRNAGELRDVVELQTRSQVASGTSDLADSYTIVATVRARVRALFGTKVIDNVQTQERATHVFVIYHRSDVQAWQFLQANGKRYRVVQVMEPDDRRRWLEVLAEEIKVGL